MTAPHQCSNSCAPGGAVSEPGESKQPDVREEALSARLDGNGGLAAAIVGTISQPLLVLDGALTIEAANPAFLENFEVTPEETVGRRLYDLGDGQWNIPELRRLLEEVLSENEQVENYRVEHEFERIGRKTMQLNAKRLRRAGASDRILLAISDVTERERLLFELEGRREFAEKLTDSVREGLVVLGWDLRVRSANLSFYQTFHVDPADTQGRLIYELGSGQWNIPRLRELLEEILPLETRFDDFEVEHQFEHIGRRIMLLNACRLDHEHLILLAIRDVTEERRAEAQRNALTGELQHRVKNILNNVRALAAQTRQGSRTLDEFIEAFDARLSALARTQDLLVRGPLEKVQLVDLVRFELEASGGHEGSNFALTGPAVRLSPRDAQAMAMTVHELATNAVKYGALSADAGHVEVAWRTEQRDAQTHLWLRWRERGLELRNTAPEKGFGSRVIEESLPYIFGGTSQLTFHSDGVECVIEFPLPEV
jgi:two-component sensor histidine kinase/PAS domain-containing protein